jgi:hypothetical protein
VLNNYHNLRSTQMLQQKPKYAAPLMSSAVHQTQRALQQQQQYQPSSSSSRKWVSSSSSRKTTTSSTGRPTWLDRVEEEHMRMFS